LAAAGAFDGSPTTDGCAGDATLVGEVATDDFAATGAFHGSATTDGFAGDVTVIGLNASLARLDYSSPILVAWATKSS